MSRQIEVAIWTVQCKTCNIHGEVYVLPGVPYGRLLGRTQSGELVELDAYQDDLYAEISNRIDKIVHRTEIRGDCFRTALGAVCDPAPSGESFDFSGQLRCPSCESTDVVYGPTNPAQTRPVCVPRASHSTWNSLTESEQSQLLLDALTSEGCI